MTEFSPATASPLGQSWAFHQECRRSLEKDYLHTFFVHAVGVAREAAPAAASGSDQGVCLACVKLLTAILQWDFRYGGVLQPGGVKMIPVKQSTLNCDVCLLG